MFVCISLSPHDPNCPKIEAYSESTAVVEATAGDHVSKLVGGDSMGLNEDLNILNQQEIADLLGYII